MRKLFLLLLIIVTSVSINAQVPQKMTYQCVVRNTSGVLVTNQAVGIRISVVQGTPEGTVVYQEIFNPNPETNANGLLSIEIGTGLAITGSFSSINWATGVYYLKTEIDPAGTTNYSIVGASQLLSVPYALYSKLAQEPADNSVTSVKIVDGSITTADLANGSVTSAKLADESVNSAKIVDGSIATVDLANNSITSAKIADGTITAADIANNTVTASKISSSGASADHVLQYNGSSVTWGYSPGSLINYSFMNANCPTSVNFTTTASKISNIGTITKLDPTSRLEVTFYGRVRVGALTTSSGAYFELRVNDNATTNGRANVNVRAAEIGGDGVPVCFTGVFTGLAAGNHTINMWVRSAGISGTGSGAMYNPGCWAGDYVIVKEIK